MQFDGVVLDSACSFVFTVSLTPAATAGASGVEQAFSMPASIPRLKPTDHVDITSPGSGNHATVGNARINAAGQLVIQFVNPNAGSQTHAAGVFIVKVTRA